MKYKLSARLGPSTWNEANRTCAEMGQNLLAIQSEDKGNSLPNITDGYE